MTGPCSADQALRTPRHLRPGPETRLRSMRPERDAATRGASSRAFFHCTCAFHSADCVNLPTLVTRICVSQAILLLITKQIVLHTSANNFSILNAAEWHAKQ